MANFNGSLKSYNILYDFDIDGGAIGSIPMGLFIPKNVLILNSAFQCITSFSGGAGATFSVGILNDLTAFLGLSSGVVTAAGNTGNGIYTVRPEIVMTESTEVLFTIGTNIITAGSMILTMIGFEKTI